MTEWSPDIPVAATTASAAGLLVGTIAYGIFHPRTRLFGPVVGRGPAGAAGVALTFDDGPTPGSTDRVLDALGETGVRAAFFVVGRNAERWPDLVRRMDAEGHVVANHTYDHSHTGMLGWWAYWRREVARADESIEQIIGKRPAFFRPPMGLKTWHVIHAARRRGQTVVTWTRRARDAEPTDVDGILGRLVGPTRPGEILVLHDGIEPHARPRDPSPTHQSVRPLVAGLRRRGLELVRLDELLGVEPYIQGAAVERVVG